MDIRITDIFNINIETKKTNKEYIVLDINSDYIDDYLTSINQYNGIYIYKLNKTDKLKYRLSKVGINMDDYIELGNYMIYDSNSVKILLINKNNTKITNRYNLIDTIGNLYIWKPISIYPNYTNIGVVITSNPHDLPEDYIGLIPTQHIKIFDNSYSQLFQNDYNLLGCSKDNKKKLSTINILNENEEYNNDENENENENREIIFNGDWNVYKSKYLILAENNNPWFKNNKKNIPSEYINNSDYFKKINKINRRKNIKSEQKIQKAEKIDKSNKSNKSDNKIDLNLIIIIMVVLIISLLLYNFLRRKQKLNNII